MTLKPLAKWNPINSKKMTILRYYAPSDVAEWEYKESFYNELSHIISKIPKEENAGVEKI